MQARGYAKLTLDRNIWNPTVRKNLVNKALKITAENLESRLKENIDNSTPAGRFYKVTEIKVRGGRAPKRIEARGKSYSKAYRTYEASRIYQASEWGQPPAKRLGELYDSIEVKRIIGEYAVVARVSAPGVAYLDSEDHLNRQFFDIIVYPYFYQDFTLDVRDLVTAFLDTQGGY